MSLSVVPMTLREARAYVDEHHRHHRAPQGGLFAIGAAEDDAIVGVVIVGMPVARMLADGFTCEVTRLASDGSRNVCSMLYRAAWRAARAMGYRRLVTYTLPEEGGTSLRAAGFTDNPAAHVKLPRVEHDPVRPLTRDEAEALRAAVADEWIGPFIRLLLGSGLRRGEAIGLDQRDLMLDAGFVRVRRSKTDARAVPISDDAVAALKQALKDAPRRGPDEPVFFGPRLSRDRLRGSSVTHALPRILEAAGLSRLTPHMLRHGAATLMLADGHPMRVIAEQLGHRNPALTARVYAHVVPEAQRSAVASLERRTDA